MNPLRRAAHLLRQGWLSLTMRSSGDYWERRYRLGMTSGPGSTGKLAIFKAEVLNRFVRDNGIGTVIEFGCGDGTQLAFAEYPSYLGIDVSPAAIDRCCRRFAGDATKSFRLQGGAGGAGDVEQADLTLSLDVIYHLLEDPVYHRYMDDLFGASRRWVVVYSSNREESTGARHVRHRRFLDDVRARFPEFSVVGKVENPFPAESFADFYFFERTSSASAASRP